MKFMAYTLAFAAFSPSGCNEDSAERDHAKVEAQQSQYEKSQPIPQFEYSQERDIVIQLYSARNERVATHTVWRSNSGMIEGDCPSVAYPIPYDTSLTNPLTPQDAYRGSVAIEQPEPNGIFASKNSTATWVRCVVDGHEAPLYVESKVTAYPYPVKVDYETNRVLREGSEKPSVVITKKK